MTLTRKLTLSFLLVAVTAAALVAVFIRQTNATRLNDLILEQQRSDFAAIITSYYQQTGSTAGLELYQRKDVPDPHQPLPPDQFNPSPRAPERRDLFGFANADGVVILPLGKDYQAGTRLSADILDQNTPVDVDGTLVGTILSKPVSIDLTPEEKAYLQRTNQALTLAALAAAALAVVIGLLLARSVVRPLQALTRATERMADGDLEQRVNITSQDEIGELAKSFNRMSHQVAHANLLRKQMTADVAHDLRTPLTVIAGYVESMRDGDLAVTPERLEIIYKEIEHLQSLVQDLRLLAVADAGELQLNRMPFDVGAWLERIRTTFQLSLERNGLRLNLDMEPGLSELNADEARLDRVLANLVMNAVRHTPRGGIIDIKTTRKDRNFVLSVQDTGEGIPTADLPHIFDRFYRVDKSRSDSDGAASGLGLAIAKALVEAHGGNLTVKSEIGKGTVMTITLPM